MADKKVLSEIDGNILGIGDDVLTVRDDRFGTEEVADASDAEATYEYSYTTYKDGVIDGMGRIPSETSVLKTLLGWIKGKLLTVESLASDASDMAESAKTIASNSVRDVATGERKNGAVSVSRNGLISDVQISNYGDADISNIGDGTITGAIKSASESGGGLQTIEKTKEQYDALPEAERKRTDIVYLIRQAFQFMSSQVGYKNGKSVEEELDSLNSAMNTRIRGYRQEDKMPYLMTFWQGDVQINYNKSDGSSGAVYIPTRETLNEKVQVYPCKVDFDANALGTVRDLPSNMYIISAILDENWIMQICNTVNGQKLRAHYTDNFNQVIQNATVDMVVVLLKY